MSKCICVATGPSLTRDKINLINKSPLTVIAVNNSFQLIDYNWVVMCDRKFISKNKDHIPWHRLYTTSTTIARLQPCNLINIDKSKPFNSGALAITVAKQLGFTEIILAGYDCSIKKGLHYFGSHKETDGLSDPTEETVKQWLQTYSQMDMSGVINTSPSDIPCKHDFNFNYLIEVSDESCKE